LGDQWRAGSADPFAAPALFGNETTKADQLPAPANFIDRARAAPELSGIIVAQGPGARERSLILEDVYRDVPDPPGGYRVATEGELGRLGLRPTELSATDGRFGARVYVRSADGATDVVVAFQAGRAHDMASGITDQTGHLIYTVVADALQSADGKPAPAAQAFTSRSASVAAFGMSGELLSTIQLGGLRTAAALQGRI
jgi:hypothetical protein